MAQHLTWLAAVLRAAGLAVREVAGWQTRGHGAMSESIVGVLCHHTAGSASGLYPSERVVVQGRTGLPGPLCNLGLDRAGTWVVVAAGQAYHAGTGSLPWCPAGQGNSRLIGIEAESTGVKRPDGSWDWTDAQRVSYPRGVAALVAHLRLGPDRVAAHREWAPGRKIDPAGIDMPAFRRDVTTWMNTLHRPPLTREEPLMALSDAEQRELLDRVRDIAGLRMDLPAGARHPGTLANALISLWAQTFHDTEIGPALVGRGSVTGVAALSDDQLARIGRAVCDEQARRLAG